ncbi:MAG: CCA tRNA nucleotidyltransferase [Pseudomonadota bacterium]
MTIAPAWLEAPATRAVLKALGAEAFFVGGCVRNALLGRPSDDVDLATPLVPETVIGRLEAAGLKAVPTGLDHGTVTAVSGGIGFEITTYRADVATDGRRAVVRFTEDRALDASRRDFTMNALYADAVGRVIDPLGGLPDLRAGRVRFIGDSTTRIAEDALRILRFFRFTAWYGRAGLDAEGLAASQASAAKIERLSRERIGAECAKLFAAPDPSPAVAAMAAAGVLSHTLPGADIEGGPRVLSALIALEAAARAVPCWLCRLAALSPVEAERALRLSRAKARTLADLQRLSALDEPPEILAERAGIPLARQAVLLRAARSHKTLPDALEARLSAGAAAVFPLEARHLIAAGVPRGPAIGHGLERARTAWRASGFRLDRAALVRLSSKDGQQG